MSTFCSSLLFFLLLVPDFRFSRLVFLRRHLSKRALDDFRDKKVAFKSDSGTLFAGDGPNASIS